MAVKQTDLAAHFCITKQSVAEAVKKGMPLTSIVEAEAWRNNRRGGRVSSAPVKGKDAAKETQWDAEQEEVEVGDVAPVTANTARAMLNELQRQLDQQRKIVKDARENFARLLTGDVVAANQASGIYNAAVKLKVMLEKELVQRKIDAGDLIPKAVALERSVRVLASIRAAIEAGKSEVVANANPDAPLVAAKAFDQFADKVFAMISEGGPK